MKKLLWSIPVLALLSWAGLSVGSIERTKQLAQARADEQYGRLMQQVALEFVPAAHPVAQANWALSLVGGRR